jgi:hypothetical protein
MVGIRSPDGLVVGSCTSHPGVLGSIPKREEPGKTGRHPVLKYLVPHGSGEGGRGSSSSNVYFMHGRDVNGGHCVSPGGLQAHSLPQPWLCRAPKVRRGGEGCAYVSM